MRWMMAMFLVGCLGKEADTTFPEGLEPLEENTADWPATLSETISTAGGDSGASRGRGSEASSRGGDGRQAEAAGFGAGRRPALRVCRLGGARPK